MYEEWASFRRDQMDTLLSDVTLPLHLTDGKNCEFNYWLSKFETEIRHQDGTDYPPNKITNIISGIQCQRRKRIDGCWFWCGQNRSDPVLGSDEDNHWYIVFSKDNSLSLTFAVFFYNCKLFGLRGMDEHKDLASEQFNVSNDEIGKYVLFSSRVCKNV